MSSRNLLKIAAIVLAAFLLGACSVSKEIAGEQYILKKNIIETDRSTPRKERVTATELNKYIKQKPPGNLLGIRTWLYGLADPQKENWWNNTLRRIGTQSIVLDTTLTAISAENIKRYIDSRGYFQSSEKYSVKLDSARHKAKVTYTTRQGAPYVISKLTYDISDPFIERMLAYADTTDRLRVGDILDNNRFSSERTRISDFLKKKGYYNFSIDNIRFSVDTMAGDHTAKVKVIVRSSDDGGIEGQGTVYRIKEVNVYPDYDAAAAMNDAGYFSSLDTISFDGVNILYHGTLSVRPEVLRKLIYLSPGNIYNEEEVNRTYSSIIETDYFKSANILFTQLPSTGGRTVTFVGNGWNDTASAPEGEIVCDIRCIPALRQSFSVEAEASTTSSFYGISATVGYQNRNIFRGAEVLDMSVKVGYELLKNKGTHNSYEFGVQTSLTFPSFIAPVDFNRDRRLRSPQTKMELSVSLNNRPYYERVLSSATFGYSWNNGRHSTYQIRPIDINIVKLNYISQAFLDRLENPYLKNSYSSQFMAGMSGSFLYNNQGTSANGNSLVVRLNWETMGNLLYGAHRLFSANKGESHYNMLGIRFAQYARMDASIVKTVMLGDVTSLAGRLYGGYGFTYGNSEDSSLPFDRFFYAGGINSMRGWLVRTLGPGTSTVPEGITYPSQLGNMRLEANLELRFPVVKSLHGALFFDAGNVWYTGDDSLDDPSVFHFDTFLGQMGFNTGLGVRLDFKVTVVRLDWGIRLHNPNNPAGERWIHGFHLDDTALNFGIGYPF